MNLPRPFAIPIDYWSLFAGRRAVAESREGDTRPPNGQLSPGQLRFHDRHRCGSQIVWVKGNFGVRLVHPLPCIAYNGYSFSKLKSLVEGKATV